MIGSLSLGQWFVVSHVLLVFILGITGYLVYTRAESHHRRVFVGYIGFGVCWTVTATIVLLVEAQQVRYALLLLANLFALCTVAAIGYFAAVYTNRSVSPREPQNAAFLGLFSLSAGIVITQPLLGLQYETIDFRQNPISYIAIEPGPGYILGVVMTIGVLVVSIAYLARLFISSPHRQTSSMLLLGVAAVLSVLPNTLSILKIVPLVPEYDYTVFGIAPFTVVLAYVVFFRGELDLAPVARNEIVDEIDDALFGLDDAGRIIDYNAAARALLPPEADEPIGAKLETRFPSLAEQITLPADPDADITATYTTVVDGVRTHYSVSVTPISERDTIAGYTVILRDVTAVESTKQKLEQQNEQLEAFATTVAHDLRNPLSIANGKSVLLTEQVRAADEISNQDTAVEYLERVTESVSRMDRVLSELETLVEHAQSVTEAEQLDFEETVLTAQERADADAIALTVETDGWIEADPARLSSILETLFRYSIDHDGTSVTLKLTEAGFVYEDDSNPIPAAEQEAVFEHDTTTSAETAGLGLTIVRTEAKSQGWHVTIESIPDGNQFVVSDAETSLSNANAKANANSTDTEKPQ